MTKKSRAAQTVKSLVQEGILRTESEWAVGQLANAIDEVIDSEAETRAQSVLEKKEKGRQVVEAQRRIREKAEERLRQDQELEKNAAERKTEFLHSLAEIGTITWDEFERRTATWQEEPDDRDRPPSMADYATAFPKTVDTSTVGPPALLATRGQQVLRWGCLVCGEPTVVDTQLRLTGVTLSGYLCKECHKTRDRWQHTPTRHSWEALAVITSDRLTAEAPKKYPKPKDPAAPDYFKDWREQLWATRITTNPNHPRPRSAFDWLK